ncbi:MAG: NAD(P)H-hydrate epimerase [Eubacteriales bacterium]|nr:NAD(P)H-hydrate epimerase [Eubacteriales bacterium]
MNKVREKSTMLNMLSADMNIVTSSQMKEIERRSDKAGLSYYQMMENAGNGAAEHIAKDHSVFGKSVLIFCGKGNNGGDGFVAARRLYEMGANVKIVLVEGEPKTEDAIKNKQLCESLDLPFYNGNGNESEVQLDVSKADIIIDAIYGTGFHGELREPVRKITRLINSSEAYVYALDVPSGLNGDSGYADSDTVSAYKTIVFHRLKPAHADERCIRYLGQVICISIGIELVLGADS